MAKVKSNAAEIIITILTIIMLLCSCSSTYQCPAYTQIECENCDELD